MKRVFLVGVIFILMSTSGGTVGYQERPPTIADEARILFLKIEEMAKDEYGKALWQEVKKMPTEEVAMFFSLLPILSKLEITGPLTGISMIKAVEKGEHRKAGWQGGKWLLGWGLTRAGHPKVALALSFVEVHLWSLREREELAPKLDDDPAMRRLYVHSPELFFGVKFFKWAGERLVAYETKQVHQQKSAQDCEQALKAAEQEAKQAEQKYNEGSAQLSAQFRQEFDRLNEQFHQAQNEAELDAFSKELVCTSVEECNKLSEQAFEAYRQKTERMHDWYNERLAQLDAQHNQGLDRLQEELDQTVLEISPRLEKLDQDCRERLKKKYRDILGLDELSEEDRAAIERALKERYGLDLSPLK